MARVIGADETFAGTRVSLRLAALGDCTDRYVAWLQDAEVNRYLETRWTPQTVDSIRAFVGGLLASEHSYLFAILSTDPALPSGTRHVGNIKVGPIDARHACADVSYFIGERAAWGRGVASDAVGVASRVGFERLGLHRLQAGAYGGNGASARVLEKCGYALEGRLRGRLRQGDGWEDHLWYGLLRDDWARQQGLA